MPPFEYKAKKQNAETVSGKLIADDRDDAIEKINQMGLIPVTVEDRTFRAQSQGLLFGARVSTKELYRFSRQLVSLLKSGVAILRALEIMAAQIRNSYFRGVVESVRHDIQEGRSFSESLSSHPAVFPPMYVTMARSGEESGKLKECITDVAQYLKVQADIGSKVRTALAYPFLMLLFGIGSVIYILTNVMPKITQLFINLNQELPLPTIIVMRLSEWMKGWGMWTLPALVLAAVYFKRWTGTAPGRAAISKLKLSIPFIRNFTIRVELARFTRSMELLLRSGVSIVRAIQLSIPAVENNYIAKELEQCQADLLAGKSLGQSLRQSKLIPEMMGQLIVVGEESGALGDTLGDIADNYEQETGEIIKVMTTLIEPLLIIFVGSIVGFIVMAMLLPIFQLDIMAR